jgi:PBP1b-binding outer membrane lipoprotein LpoB
MRMKLLKRLIASVLAVVLLTGCSSMSSGVKVGDQEISTTEIQKSVDEILQARETVDTSRMNLVEGAELLRDQAQFFVVRVLMFPLQTLQREGVK